MAKSNWLILFSVFLKCIGKISLKQMKYMSKQLRFEYPKYHNEKLYINTFFPPVPSKSFDRFFDIISQQKRLPISAYIALTDECPFSCSHCSYGNHSRGQLGTSGMLSVIRQMKNLGIPVIGFTGGEPLLRRDLEALISEASTDCETILFTTGYSMTSEIARRLRAVGLGSVMFGFESSNLSEHDEIRGVNGSFTIAIKAVENAKRAGLYTAISTVATKSKLHSGEIQRLADFANTLDVNEFRILEPLPVGSMKGACGELLSEEDSAKLKEFHCDWNKSKKTPTVAAFSHLESKEMFGCGAGYHHLYIDALGNICPCDLSPFSFGNISNESLEDIWNRMGEYFPKPTQQCFSKLIMSKLGDYDGEFPVPHEIVTKIISEQNCRRSDELPGAYENLLS